MKKILFLDINGVLIPQRFNQFNHTVNSERLYQCLSKYTKLELAEITPTDFKAFSTWIPKETIECLQQLVEDKQISIVLSSNWSVTHSFKKMQNLFRMIDLNHVVIDQIELGENINKVEAIELWISQHEVHNYCVVDDIDFSVNFPNHFVLSSNYFDQEVYRNVTEILK